MSARPSKRLPAIVIVAAMLGWMGLSFLGGQLGWPPRYAILIDLSALAAMVWALIVLLRLYMRDDG